MMFLNDSACALIMEGCTKGKRMDDVWKREFMASLSVTAEEESHKAAMKDLMNYMKDAITVQ